MIQNKISVWLMLLLLAACTPKWDDHYDVNQATVTNQTVLEYLQSCPEYSKFVALLKEVNTDTIFGSKTQVTVWVPTNDKVPDLSGLSDSLKVLTIANHISTLPYATVDMKDQTRVTAFSGKKLGIYSDDNVSFRVNNCRLSKTDMICKDGVVQEISGWLALQPNLKEYITSAPEYTMLQALIDAKQDTVFDKKNSTPTGELDVLGRPIYDSVFLYVNRFYNRTNLDKENMTFTVFLTPDWVLEEEIEQYYKAYRNYWGDAPKHDDSLAVTTWLVNSIPYQGVYTDFTGKDKLYSIYSVAWRPDYQRLGEMQEFSNGVAWQMSDLYIPRTMIFPKDGGGQAYTMFDIYTKSQESINLNITGLAPDVSVTNPPVITAARDSGYKVVVTPIDENNAEPFNMELSWTLGKTSTGGLYYQVVQIPGEYKMEFTFKKNEELETDFEIYVNGNFIARVNMADYKDVAENKEIKITKRMTIGQEYAEIPTQITLRAIGGTGGKQALSVYSVFFQPTSNNY